MEYSIKVLVVDDHPSMRSIIKKMLHQMGCCEAIEDACNGEEGWEKLCEQPYDLVICDLDMPRAGGINLLKRCRAYPQVKDIPFLMVSGEAVQEVVAFAGEWGAYDYIIKPFSYTLLKGRIDRIMERFHDPEEVLYREVERLRDEGRFDTAVATVEEWESKSPNSRSRWLNLKGECLMQMGEMDRAAVCFEKALGLSSIYLAAYKNYAELQQKIGNIDRAIEALEKADLISPLAIDRKITLGKLLIEKGREEEGRAFLNRALKQSPPEDRSANRIRVAEAYLENGLFAEAEELFTKAVKENPDEIEIYNRLGISLRRQGKYDEAERYYRLALARYPDNAAINYNLGVLQLNKREKGKAYQFFRQALELDPAFKKAEEMLRHMDASP